MEAFPGVSNVAQLDRANEAAGSIEMYSNCLISTLKVGFEFRTINSCSPMNLIPKLRGRFLGNALHARKPLDRLCRRCDVYRYHIPFLYAGPSPPKFNSL